MKLEDISGECPEGIENIVCCWKVSMNMSLSGQSTTFHDKYEGLSPNQKICYWCDGYNYTCDRY